MITPIERGLFFINCKTVNLLSMQNEVQSVITARWLWASVASALFHILIYINLHALPKAYNVAIGALDTELKGILAVWDKPSNLIAFCENELLYK